MAEVCELHNVRVEREGLHGGSVSNLWLAPVCVRTDKEQQDLSSVKSYNKPNTRTYRRR